MNGPVMGYARQAWMYHPHEFVPMPALWESGTVVRLASDIFSGDWRCGDQMAVLSMMGIAKQHRYLVFTSHLHKAVAFLNDPEFPAALRGWTHRICELNGLGNPATTWDMGNVMVVAAPSTFCDWHVVQGYMASLPPTIRRGVVLETDVNLRQWPVPREELLVGISWVCLRGCRYRFGSADVRWALDTVEACSAHKVPVWVEHLGDKTFGAWPAQLKVWQPPFDHVGSR